jgi:TonB family protein
MKPTLPLLIVAVSSLLLLGIPASTYVLAQDTVAFDVAPSPEGGLLALMQQIPYPASAKKDGIEGKVLLSIVVGTDGQVKSAEITRSVRNDLDQAALQAIQASKWTPAQKGGKPVESNIVVPVQFKLEDKSKK